MNFWELAKYSNEDFWKCSKKKRYPAKISYCFKNIIKKKNLINSNKFTDNLESLKKNAYKCTYIVDKYL